MPQLEQIHTFTSQIFWLFVCLGVVYFFLSKLAVPKLSKVIESRETAIASDVNAAEHFKNTAQQVNGEFEARTASSRADAFTITTEATKRGIALYEKNMNETDAQLKKDIEASEKEVNLAKEKAIAELNANILAYVNEIVEKVAGIKIEKAKVEKLLKTGS